MDSLSNNDAVIFLKSIGLPESKFLVNGEIVDLYHLLGITPQFHSDGTRVLTPYEIIGIPPQFSDDGKEIPIVFILKNRCNKIGKFEGKTLDFLCKNKKVHDKKTTLEELKSRYKQAVLSGDDVQAEELFQIIDSMSGGKAKELLSSFFDYTKYYKRLKKQLLIDLFAHFFMLYIYSMVRSAKGGVLRKNKIFKPFKASPVEMETAPVSNENISETMVKEVLNPQDYGINNLESITIESNVSGQFEDEMVELNINSSTQKPEQVEIMQNVEELEQKVEKPSKKIEKKKEQKSFLDEINEMFDEEQKKVIYNTNTDVDSQDEFSLNQTEQIDLNSLEVSDIDFDKLSFEELEAIQKQFGNVSASEIAMAENQPQENVQGQDSQALQAKEVPQHQNIGDEQSSSELERESVIKKKKRVTVKKYGAQFNSVTGETKSNENELESENEKQYDLEV